jgi:cytochrome c biogenesis protein CcdA
MSNEVTFSFVTINALIDSINPCAIGVLTASVAILFSLGNYRAHILRFGSFYILATYVTYLLIGLGILKAVHLFGVHNFFGWASAIALIFMGFWHLKKPACIIPKNAPKEATIIAGIVFGVLVGICEFPCSGAVYLATIGLIGVEETFWSGLLYLLWYNLVFVLPLILLFALAYNLAAARAISRMVGVFGTRARYISCVAMIVMGVLLLLWLTFR